MVAAASPTFSTDEKREVESRALYWRSPLHWGGCGAIERCGDAWWWLRRQFEVELLEQDLLFGVELGIAAQDQGAAIGCREVHVEHLHGSELVEHGPGSEARCQRAQSRAQRDVKAIGEEGDEDVSFDALLELVVDRA